MGDALRQARGPQLADRQAAGAQRGGGLLGGQELAEALVVGGVVQERPAVGVEGDRAVGKVGVDRPDDRLVAALDDGGGRARR